VVHRVLRLAALIALTGLSACTSGVQSTETLVDDSDLPPIVVLGGSMNFTSDDGWEEPGNSGRWRQRSSTGGAPAGFRVVDDDGTDCLPRGKGFLEITYTEQGGPVRTFELLFAGPNVFLNPNGLELSQNDSGRTLTYTPAGTPGTIRFKNSTTPECTLAAGQRKTVYAQKVE
jgi:hypothetical protein